MMNSLTSEPGIDFSAIERNVPKILLMVEVREISSFRLMIFEEIFWILYEKRSTSCLCVSRDPRQRVGC